MSTAFVRELEAWKTERLDAIVATGRTSITADAPADATRMLQIALANEISVSELAAAWVATTPEVDVKIAFARQAGDEAGHFMLVSERLGALGFDAAAFQPPVGNPLFEYMRQLPTTVERIAASLFTLESIAYGVNENFMALCAQRGDAETVRIYREYIQPDERAHQELGQRLLAKYAATAEHQALARATAARVLEIAGAARAAAAAKLGTACFPGC
ncbi:MAG: ferritin-like domain-containing protein [Deltaproteobacteria bacterium]|nr:ferritin-like domain-containing protein [Deltaproteobacteria bacterium]MCW5803677.1 ferritin-like domain-containing protein [Deltaproteobacteria bacterium]